MKKFYGAVIISDSGSSQGLYKYDNGRIVEDSEENSYIFIPESDDEIESFIYNKKLGENGTAIISSNKSINRKKGIALYEIFDEPQNGKHIIDYAKSSMPEWAKNIKLDYRILSNELSKTNWLIDKKYNVTDDDYIMIIKLIDDLLLNKNVVISGNESFDILYKTLKVLPFDIANKFSFIINGTTKRMFNTNNISCTNLDIDKLKSLELNANVVIYDSLLKEEPIKLSNDLPVFLKELYKSGITSFNLLINKLNEYSRIQGIDYFNIKDINELNLFINNSRFIHYSESFSSDGNIYLDELVKQYNNSNKDTSINKIFINILSDIAFSNKWKYVDENGKKILSNYSNELVLPNKFDINKIFDLLNNFDDIRDALKYIEFLNNFSTCKNEIEKAMYGKNIILKDDHKIIRHLVESNFDSVLSNIDNKNEYNQDYISYVASAFSKYNFDKKCDYLIKYKINMLLDYLDIESKTLNNLNNLIKYTKVVEIFNNKESKKKYDIIIKDWIDSLLKNNNLINNFINEYDLLDSDSKLSIKDIYSSVLSNVLFSNNWFNISIYSKDKIKNCNILIKHPNEFNLNDFVEIINNVRKDELFSYFDILYSKTDFSKKLDEIKYGKYEFTNDNNKLESFIDHYYDDILVYTNKHFSEDMFYETFKSIFIKLFSLFNIDKQVEIIKQYNKIKWFYKELDSNNLNLNYLISLYKGFVKNKEEELINPLINGYIERIFDGNINDNLKALYKEFVNIKSNDRIVDDIISRIVSSIFNSYWFDLDNEGRQIVCELNNEVCDSIKIDNYNLNNFFDNVSNQDDFDLVSKYYDELVKIKNMKALFNEIIYGQCNYDNKNHYIYEYIIKNNYEDALSHINKNIDYKYSKLYKDIIADLFTKYNMDERYKFISNNSNIKWLYDYYLKNCYYVNLNDIINFKNLINNNKKFYPLLSKFIVSINLDDDEFGGYYNAVNNIINAKEYKYYEEEFIKANDKWETICELFNEKIHQREVDNKLSILFGRHSRSNKIIEILDELFKK